MHVGNYAKACRCQDKLVFRQINCHHQANHIALLEATPLINSISELYVFTH